MTAAILLALVGVLLFAALRLRAAQRDVCHAAVERPDLWGTHDAYVEAVLARGRRRFAAEARARRMGMTPLEVQRAGDVAAGPRVDAGGHR